MKPEVTRRSLTRNDRRADVRSTGFPATVWAIILGATFLINVGCTVHKVGTTAIRDDKTVTQVKACESADQVLEILGPPRRTDVLSNGFKRLVYIYQESEENPWRHGHQFTLNVIVDNQGAVQNVERLDHEY